MRACPAPVLCIVVPLFLAGIVVSIFILVAVHNALLLSPSSCPCSCSPSSPGTPLAQPGTALLYLESLAFSDLRRVVNGQLVKLTGFQEAFTHRPLYCATYAFNRNLLYILKCFSWI